MQASSGSGSVRRALAYLKKSRVLGVVDYFYRVEFHSTPRFFSDSNYLFFFVLLGDFPHLLSAVVAPRGKPDIPLISVMPFLSFFFFFFLGVVLPLRRHLTISRYGLVTLCGVAVPAPFPRYPLF